MTKSERQSRKHELFNQALKELKNKIVDFPAYEKQVAKLCAEGVGEEAAAQQAHKEFIANRFSSLDGKKLRFLAKQKADRMLAEEQ